MSLRSALNRFRPHGVFWRHFLTWALENVPHALEPLTMWLWSFFFFAFWANGRRGVAHNLGIIIPGSWRLTNTFRAYRVFLNFAWTFSDSARFHSEGRRFDWELVGSEHLDKLSLPDEKAIVLTAHMGNYDLGSYIFSKRVKRPIATVRAPEIDPESQQYSAAQRERLGDGFRVHYNTSPGSLALELVYAIGRGEVVAIQGDRALPGAASAQARMFGRSVALPSGPFALALATRASVYPLFILRAGHRRYRVIAGAPIPCERQGPSKDAAISEAIQQWACILEEVVRDHWFQWFAFEPIQEGTSE